MDAGNGESDRERGVVVESEPGEHLGTAVARALGEAMDVPSTELDVELDDYVDLDAVDNLFAACYDGSARGDGRVTFSVAGYQVTVVGTRRVVVDPTSPE